MRALLLTLLLGCTSPAGVPVAMENPASWTPEQNLINHALDQKLPALQQVANIEAALRTSNRSTFREGMLSKDIEANLAKEIDEYHAQKPLRPGKSLSGRLYDRLKTYGVIE
jgi:hypothetical protein